MHFIFTLAAVAAAYWVYQDARTKGYTTSTVLLWTIGTLMMMVIVLPLYLLFGRRPKGRTRRGEQIIDVEATAVVDETNKIDCPMCGSKVQEDFKLCPYCGYTLKPKCLKCGQDVSREWRKCPYCQTPTPEK